MNHRVFASIAALTLLTLLSVQFFGVPTANGQESRPARQERPRGEGRRPDGPGGGGSVEGAMKLTNRSLKALNDQIGDASKKRENLKLISDAERGIATAKALPLPDEFTKKATDEAAKSKIADDSRRELVAVLRALLDVETAIDDGKLDVAKAKLKDVLKMRDDAHERLGVKED